MATAVPTVPPLRNLPAADPQSVRPHRFVGTARIGGQIAPSGTVISAVVDNQTVKQFTVTGTNPLTGAASPGFYYADIVPASGQAFDGKTVTFFIGNTRTAQSGTYVNGGVSVLDLSV